MTNNQSNELRNKYPINTFHGTTQDELVEFIQDRERQARIDENQSLLSVAEHEIGLPDHCDMHDRYVSQCNACKKRKWYGEISKDWKRVIADRITELKGDKS